MISSIDLTFDDINSVDPSYVYTYLENSGWQEESKIDDRAVIFTIYKNQEKYSILLPIDKEIPDFCSRMYDVLRTLEFIEDRSKAEILKLFKTPHQVALEQQTEIISLRFQFIYDEHKKQFSAKKMGVVLVSLQDLLNAVGQSETGQDSSRGKIPEEILEKTEISVFETFQGSFGLKLAFARLDEQLNLLERRPLPEIVSSLILELIKLSNSSDKENLKQMLLRLKRRTASRYRKFLAELILAQSNFYIDWGSVNPEAGGHAYLTYENTINTVEFINKMEAEEPAEFTIRGELISASNKSNRKYLEILDNEGITYKGDISDSMSTDIELTIGRLYEVTFEELTSINPATGEEKIERNVVAIRKIND